MIRTFFKKCRQTIDSLAKEKKATINTPEPAETAPAPHRKKQRRRRRTKKRPSGSATGVSSAPETSGSWDVSQFLVPPEKGKTRFHDLDFPSQIMQAVADIGFRYLTPIQADVLQETLNGRDAAGRAQTGTGKTAAFLLTILTKFLRDPGARKKRHGAPRALILAPTRELVMQIVEDAHLLAKYCPITVVGVLGGIDYDKQKRQLTGQQVDIVVATPGRLLDFQRKKYIHLNSVEILVIDEADRMLDMGFIPDVRTIVHSTPGKEKRQTLLFSATLTDEVTRLSAQWTKDPVIVSIEPEQVVTETVDQVVYLTTRKEKFALLYNLITRQHLERVIVFCNRRDETRSLHEKLKRYDIDCAMLSGEVPQHRRVKTLEKFKKGAITVLVATDVAGRGIHVDGISHVVNYTLPEDAESYVHRIGRTGRAGVSGTSVSFADESDSFCIPDIETFIGADLHCIYPDEKWLQLPPAPPAPPAATTAKKRQKGRRSSRQQSGRPRTRRGGTPKRTRR